MTVAVGPSGRLLASAGADGLICIWDISTGSEEPHAVLEGHLGSEVSSVCFHPKCMLLASVSTDNTLQCWDAEEGAHLQMLTGHTDEVFSCSFSPQGNVLVTASKDGNVSLWGTDDSNLRRA